ncbi:MAG TPA: GNAT family N-acetyltransferase, partial [Chthonomonadales bacterium]|nr:GNAT family N-acetyltransferase [Chthonomonadales bacterium]
NAGGSIAGATYVLDPQNQDELNDFCLWQHLLGAGIGGIGPLGVAESMRGKGIGLALAARATELLQQRGLALSFVGYTWLVDWYGRLGYSVFNENVMGRLMIEQPGRGRAG